VEKRWKSTGFQIQYIRHQSRNPLRLKERLSPLKRNSLKKKHHDLSSILREEFFRRELSEEKMPLSFLAITVCFYVLDERPS
jgi:hypothetical protein